MFYLSYISPAKQVTQKVSTAENAKQSGDKKHELLIAFNQQFCEYKY
jgi:hypothetical protein